MKTSYVNAAKHHGPRPSNPTLCLLALAITFIAAVAETTRAATINVPAGGSLQAALDAAQPGDEVVLEAGATFVGNFILPVKPGASYITVRSSRAGELPAGRRVSPADAPLLARVATPNGSAALSAPVNSHHWRLVGLEVTQSGSFNTDGLIVLGDGDAAGPQDTPAEAPHHLIVERCYLHAFSAATPLKRGVALNSAHTDVLDSYISGAKAAGQDAQAVGGWNGPGPFRIDNNFLEAAGENVLFGGATPAIPGLVPSDIVIRRNHLYKPLSWRVGDPAYAGTAWTVKNLLELKSARRVRIEGNVLENSWAHAQTGWAVIFNVFGDDTSPDRVEDVEFLYNVIRSSDNGINLRGQDVERTQTGMRRVRIAHNLLKDVGAFGGEGKVFQVLQSSESVSFDHNTVTHAGQALLTLEALGNFKHVGFSFNNNAAPRGRYGVIGTGGSLGVNALNQDCGAGGWTFARNLIAADDPQAFFFPPDNYVVPAAAYPAQFVDFAGGDYRLAATSCGSTASGCSPKGGADDRDVGADVAILNAATAGAVGGVWSPNPIDNSRYFVRQHYVDFLGREPDGVGLSFWTSEITQCGSDAACAEIKRINVSAAFFLSIEFEQTGYLAYRAWGAAYGPTRVEGQRALTRAEFLPDVSILTRNLVVGAPNWQAQLEANKSAYFDAFVARPEFTAVYLPSMTPTQYVDALNTSAGYMLSLAERDQLVADLTSGAKSRAQVLRAVAEDSDFDYQQKNRAFVTMEYFGYLRRDPDYWGYAYWLDKLNQFGGNYIAAEMVNGFITSVEYRSRFGQN